MPAVSPPAGAAARRRVPTQSRSRARVSQLVDAASRLVVDQGVDAVTTRAVADAAKMPVASLYQYFADKDAILLAMVERDTAEMDDAVAAALSALPVLSVRTIVEATMRAYVGVFHRRPAFVETWLRGRTNPAVHEFCRAHNRRTAEALLALAADRGLVAPGTPPAVVELAVEIGDRVFQLAFETELRGDAFLVEEGIAMVTGHLERHATPAGLAGVPADGAERGTP